MIDKEYCSNSYLIYRYIVREDVAFHESLKPNLFDTRIKRSPVKNSDDLDVVIRNVVNNALSKGKVALMLSGGIDSAILAKYLPEGTKTYTLKCIADGAEDETARAKVYADVCGLENEVIEVTWEDYQKYTPILMKHKGAPIHSIEPQIYKAALKAKRDGVDYLLFGENADLIYGGMDGLLKKDWTYQEFVDRYCYVKPDEVLKSGEMIYEPFDEFKINENGIDFVGFIHKHFYREACGSYTNACSTAGMKYLSPFTHTYLDTELDLERIRSGDTKYIVRELYNKLYPELKPAVKLPMPRPLEQWLKEWNGPTRCEFKKDCIKNLSANQKWMVYVLEMFLNMIDEQDVS